MDRRKPKIEPKLFVIRKYIWARDAKEAIKKDTGSPVDDVWVDDEWKRKMSDPKPAIGFASNETP